jgi:hypothetical protein
VLLSTRAWGSRCSAPSLPLRWMYNIIMLVLVRGIIYDRSALGVDLLAGLCKLKAYTCIYIS